nr:MAG TPA: hypothetical protein [Caudoviricetes sp.]
MKDFFAEFEAEEMEERARVVADAAVRQSLRHSLEILTIGRTHPAAVEEGKNKVEHALLLQLEDAVCPSGESGGGGRGAATAAPLSVDALDVQNQIMREAQGWMNIMALPAPAKLRLYMVMCSIRDNTYQLSFAQASSLAESARGWVEMIDDLLHPVRRTPVDKCCISCGYYYYMVATIDGLELMKKQAMQAVWDKDGTRIERIECQYCGAVWRRHELWELAGSTAPDPLSAASVAPAC